MEDDDAEGKVTESWTKLSESRPRKSEDTLKRTSEVLSASSPGSRLDYNDACAEDNKEDRCGSSEDSPGKNSSDEPTSKIVFKGFKKRILAQAQENRIGSRANSHENFHATSKILREKRGTIEGKRGKITEYAQYLGLQPAPTSRTKCPKCHPTTNSCPNSMLKNQQQCTCPAASPQSPGTSEAPSTITTPTTANNFRITRKVYLCAACGTYFENWNLFLHMREIHKRHICLFCLGMFGQAERLSYHLAKKHSVPETSFTSVEDFYNVFKGSCYLICCTCEKVFSETDNFYNHFCTPVQKTRNNAADVCSLCRQAGSHSSTCTLVETCSGLPGIPGMPGKNTDSPVRVSNKRPLKNNRLKRTEETLLSSYQQKLSDMYARKMTVKSRETTRQTPPVVDVEESTVSTGGSVDTATTTTTAIDTVSETIMEVSKCTEDTRRNDEPDDTKTTEETPRKNDSPAKLESSSCPSASTSPLRRPGEISLYDSVAETIMEVSRCENESGGNTSAEEEGDEVDDDGSRDTGSDNDVLIMDEVADPENPIQTTNGKEDYDDRLKRTEPEVEEPPDDETIDLSDSDDSGRTSRSPKSRLDRASESCSSPEKESHTSVSVTTVNSTDRSLVIKICTNRNSQFSVTSANGASLDNDNHDTGRESEENNNGEDSASEGKRSNNGSLNSFRGNEEEEEEEEEEDEEEDDDASDAESAKLEIKESDRTSPRAEDNKEEITTNETREEETKIIEDNESSVKFESKIEEEPRETSDDLAKIEKDEKVEEKIEPSDGIVIAAEDVPSIDLNVEGTLDSMKIEDLLKRCINAASGYCVYCNHARHIAVNGKQLGLHVLAEHRFQPQHPAIIIHREQFVARLKKSLEEVETFFFNLDSFDSTSGTYDVPNPRTFECFHCRYHSHVHKDIYLHNRKMHQKTILICIMCKSTFYSYSELLCHLCPGVYSPNINVTYRCCLCPVSSLPSAFRLMVHLRKRHHSCDVCLESTGNQQRLSNHVWKHKLHHLCYRCGIAYRNKPDITKHLFWKHGTESVLCKKCLQKKWPHVYHFCIPPTAFVCEECTSTFSRAVALKVHKRLHSGDRPYGCVECTERFISKKLLAKHEASHREPEVVPEVITKETEIQPIREEKKVSPEKELPAVSALPTEQENSVVENEVKEVAKEVKKVVDVYDLPPLNLSSDSDSDSEDQRQSTEKTARPPTESEMKIETKSEEVPIVPEVEPEEEEEEEEEDEKKEEAQIMDGIWDNFKSYAASLEKQDTVLEMQVDEKKEENFDMEFLRRVILADHDYCVVFEKSDELREEPATMAEDNCGTMEGEHDYGYKQTKSPSANSVALNCDSDTNANAKKKKDKSPRKKRSGSGTSSDSSSDSDSSSCSCGTNCSCSSSSSGSSSSSSSSSDSDSSASEGSPKKQSVRKERRKDKDKEKEQNETETNNSAKIEPIEEKVETAEVAVVEEAQKSEEANPSVEISDPPRSPQLIFRESDLDTDETETDEDFYDEHPQQLANKLLAEKRNQLMLLAAVAPAATETSATPSATPKNLNNGSIETMSGNSMETAPTRVDEVVHNSTGRQGRKRVKTKKRKRSDRAKTSRVATPTVESIKLNIPKSFYQKKHQGFGSTQPALITVLPSRSSTPNLQNSQPELGQTIAEANKTLRISIGGSGSENENKRSSKRKRVPKRFYGDSSDEEADRQQQQQLQLQHQQQQQLQLQLQLQPQQQQQQQHHLYHQQHYSQPSVKWRKVEPPFVPAITPPAQPQIQANSSTNYATKSVTLRLSGFDQPLERIVPMTTVASATESEEPAETSSESSDAEETVVEIKSQPQPQQSQRQPSIVLPVGPTVANTVPTNPTGIPGERSANLYCYCQCPYDEVSEMIACDGDDCRIEWFHFECVGIMVPPKGKWYCPDCRKKDESLPGNEEYFD